jgi:aminoglycoside/choline kinase family phosphotransferase
MSGREDRIVTFLAANGWGAARRAPLAGDASFRRYERLSGGPRPALLMDAPPPQEDVRPFVTVARHLGGLGFSAPEIYAADTEAGLLVIEDFGEDTYSARLEAGAAEEPLYALAVDLLIDLHRAPRAAELAVPPYDETRLLDEANLLVDWYLPAMRGEPTAADLKRGYIDTWRALLPLAEATPTSLVLRDYHVDNLMWLDGRAGVARCGLLDFQDAVIGSTAYDLVSLIEDARRDLAPGLAESMIARYLAAFPDLDPDAFQAAAAMLSAQRNSKIIGIFTRLSERDGKPVYLEHIPRVWRLLEGDLAHPALGPLRAWFDHHIPARDRGVPPRRTAA